MSVQPSIALVAWEARSAGFIFVAVPTERGRYVRTDKSVVLTGCTMCGAGIGEPCRGRHGSGYGGGTHSVRRSDALRLQSQRGERGARVDDQIEPVEPAPPMLPKWLAQPAEVPPPLVRHKIRITLGDPDIRLLDEPRALA